jgi:hypothetical protein
MPDDLNIPAKPATPVVNPGDKDLPVDMPEGKNPHWSSKLLRGATGLWHGPAATMGLTGVLGALAGRYVGAPLLSATMLPGEDEIGEEELKKRKEKIKKVMTWLGAAPGVLGGAAWGAERMSKHGPKGMVMGWKGKNERLFGPDKKASFAGEPDPLNPMPQPAIPIAATMGLVYSDPYLTQADKQQFAGFMMEASQGQSRGVLTTENLVKAGIGAGLGYAGANVASKVLGAVFGLSAPTKKILRRSGMIAGALYGAGIIQ